MLGLLVAYLVLSIQSLELSLWFRSHAFSSNASPSILNFASYSNIQNQCLMSPDQVSRFQEYQRFLQPPPPFSPQYSQFPQTPPSQNQFHQVHTPPKAEAKARRRKKQGKKPAGDKGNGQNHPWTEEEAKILADK